MLLPPAARVIFFQPPCALQCTPFVAGEHSDGTGKTGPRDPNPKQDQVEENARCSACWRCRAPLPPLITSPPPPSCTSPPTPAPPAPPARRRRMHASESAASLFFTLARGMYTQYVSMTLHHWFNVFYSVLCASPESLKLTQHPAMNFHKTFAAAACSSAWPAQLGLPRFACRLPFSKQCALSVRRACLRPGLCI